MGPTASLKNWIWTPSLGNLGLIGASLSKPHTSGTALQDTCVCLSVCLSAYVWPYTKNFNQMNGNEGTCAFQICTHAKPF